MNNKIFAPVLIPTLNRYEHFKRCVETLSLCELANQTVLYVVLDYPLKEKHWEGYNQIIAYLPFINAFKELHIIKREVNYGPYKNLYNSIDFLFESYEEIIFSEDDNVFSTNFLKHVNTGLRVYQHRKDIFSISGYNSPIIMPAFYKHDVYLRKGFTAWGVGLWKDKWQNVDWTMSEFNACIDDISFIKRVKNETGHLNQLLNMRKSQIPLGDGIILVHLLKYRMFSIYPVVSKVRNTGHDGSGVHCQLGLGSEKYLNQKIDEGNLKTEFLPEIVENKRLSKYIFKQRNPSLFVRIISKVGKTIKLYTVK
jgi:hypothetical protein